MDSFPEGTDLLESLQPSDHEEDNLPLKADSSADMSTNSLHSNSFSSDTQPYNQPPNNQPSNNGVYISANINHVQTTTDQPKETMHKNSSSSSSSNNNNYNFNNATKENDQNVTNNVLDQLKSVDKSQLVAIIHFLKKNNLLATEEILRKETSNFINEDDIKNIAITNINESSFSSFVYRTEGNPNIYEDNYKQLQRFVDGSLDSYRHELSKLLYPVFVHMYLELVCSEHENQAVSFMKQYGNQQDFSYSDDIQKLSLVTKREHFSMYNEVIESFRSSQQLYTIRLSRDSHSYLKRFLQDKSQSSSGKATILVNIIQEHLFIDVYDGLTRSKANVDAISGAMFGEATRDLNKNKVFYGLFKEPDFKIDMFDMDIDIDNSSNQAANDTSMTGDQNTSTSLSLKKKKSKKDTSQAKKARNDPNAPPYTRIPLPELRDAEQYEKMRARKESMKALKIGPDALPSICLYTLLNVQSTSEASAICAEISEDSSLLAVGFSDSLVRIWPLSNSSKIRALKPSTELENLDKESDDVFLKMMEDQCLDLKVFYGHSGPVYGLSFSPCKDLLLSCSEDSTIRLWSLLTWTNVVVYKGHCFPVWGVKFSPHGYYFASCSHDRTARLWATDNYNPLRYFAGHFADVDCVQFHPNSNYIATGSSDRSVRLWDCFNGQCVRHMTGHKGNIHAIAFENSGRFLATAGADKRILLWDIASGHLVADLVGGHSDSIYTLSFNRAPESIMLASGGLDNRVIFWDIQGLFENIDFEELTSTTAPTIKSKHEAYMLASYPTKATSLLLNHFTRRNLLLSVGAFQQQ